MCCFYDLKKINPEVFFLINISVLADKARLLRQVTETLSERPFQFAPLGNMETHDSHPVDGRDATRSQTPTRFVYPNGAPHLGLSCASCLDGASVCSVHSVSYVSACQDQGYSSYFKRFLVCTVSRTLLNKLVSTLKTRFQLLTATRFMRIHVWRQEENIG